ncbi:hypothetical protein COU60_02305 [Candidatus Pacearchaeota archaeon CG10_big_fil_rev_8_21_14_0_10_34_76]|nr:MAG: hypothetical protein COU60_02305 [Candidatus Pacearchaeota archaeon CG10_big_fil_rev_8_21_14_0_10_34_76]
MKQKIPPQLKRFVQYTAIGTTTFSFDLSLLYVLTEFFGVYYLLSAILSFILANSINYTINRSWGFKKTKQTLVRGYIYLMIINTASLFLIVTLMAGLVELFSFDYLIARITVGILVGGLDFIMNSKITFKTPIFKK